MKKTLLIALLLIPFLGFSQTTKPIDSFLGIKFGSTKADVIAALNARGGVMDKTDKTPNAISFYKLKLGHRDISALYVKFYNDKVYEVKFIFLPEQEARIFENYYSLINDLNDVYGTGINQTKFKSPYNDKDDDIVKIDAVKNGNADYANIWVAENKNAIQVSIVSDMAVLMIYQDVAIAAEVYQQQKSKDSKDF